MILRIIIAIKLIQNFVSDTVPCFIFTFVLSFIMTVITMSPQTHPITLKTQKELPG